jgi:flagellar biosynthesis protein FlhF
MRLKSFYAKTMTEAMKMVRDTLGEDAVIVATREEQGGAAVRVTAAIEEDMLRNENEPAFEIGRGAVPAGADDWLQYDDEEQEAAITEELTDIMLRHSVPEDVTDMILSCATLVGLEQPHIALIAAIEHLFGFRPLPVRAHKKPLIAVGPPGAGKTLAVAKMAARGIMNDLNVAVITTDTVRAGGTEQLAAFTKILRIPLMKARSAEELRDCLHKAEGADQILIDTGGTNPFDKDEMRAANRLMAVADCDPLLVMPAGGDAEESGEIARIYASAGVRWMLSTRLDIARRFGGLLQAAQQGGMAFADASATPQVADGLSAMTPKSLCDLLMPGAGGRAGKNTQNTGY